MPPKVKTTREDIINAAFEVTQKNGLAAITAQSVAKVLDISVAPIFREFQTVEQLRTATTEKIGKFHINYIKTYPLSDTVFLTYGLAYINFAKEYPNLFETVIQFSRTTVSERLTGSLFFAVDSASVESGLSVQQAKDLFFNIWIYTHGIATLLYKGSIVMTELEEKKLLVDAFTAFSKLYKNEEYSK